MHRICYIHKTTLGTRTEDMKLKMNRLVYHTILIHLAIGFGNLS